MAPNLNYEPIREPLDLGIYDERLKGKTIDLLLNPSMRFRREFVSAQGDSFIGYIAYILGMEDTATRDMLEDMEPDVMRWLFVGALDGDEFIPPHVVRLWDEYQSRRVKAWGRPSAKRDAMTLPPNQDDHRESATELESISPATSMNGSDTETVNTPATESMDSSELV